MRASWDRASASVVVPLLCLLAISLLSCVKSPSVPSADPAKAPSSASAVTAAASAPATAPDNGSPLAGPEERLYTEKPELLAYVQSVGKKVASRADGPRLDYRFDIVDSADVNAFSLPGGQVFVTRGLLARMSSEDEMAAALGREIASAVGASRGAAGPGEAESLGLKYAKAAGYKPRGAVDLLRTLAAVRSAEPPRLELWLAGHPGSAARIANLDAELEKIVRTNGETPARSVKRDPYLQRIDGIPIGWFSRDGYLKGSRYWDIRQDFSIQVPDGWTLQTRDESLVLLHPSDGTRAEVTALTNLRTGVSGDAALDYARKAPQQGYEVTKPVGHAALPIGDAAILTMQRKDESGAVTSIRKMFQVRHDKLYVLTYVVPVEREDETMDIFMKMTGSMKWLAPEETTPPAVPRLTLDTAKAGETWKSIAAERLGGDWRAATLAAWNGRDPAEAPVSGMLVKIPPLSAFE